MDGYITFPVLGLCVGVGTTVAVICVWLFAKFQTKHAADAMRKHLQAQIDRVDKDVDTVEDEVKEIKTSLANIASDVSYIRGRLEPRSKE